METLKRMRLSSVVVLSGGLLAFVGMASAHADDCSLPRMQGNWSYSEHGTHIATGAAFSEIGWLRIAPNGTGTGEAFLSIGGNLIPPVGVPSGVPLRINAINIDPVTCVGEATFIAGGDVARPRTIRFTAVSDREFYFISTTGDINGVGTAKKHTR